MMRISSADIKARMRWLCKAYILAFL